MDWFAGWIAPEDIGSQRETIKQCYLNAGPSSPTLAQQHWFIVVFDVQAIHVT